MPFSRNLLINLGIVVLFFGLLYFLLDGKSGGDIFLLIILFFSSIIHLAVILIIHFKRKQFLKESLTGFFLGLLIAFACFSFINNQKSKIVPKVKVGF